MDGADEFIPTRRTLLSRLKSSSDQDGWMTFFDTCWKLIYHAAVQAGLSDAEPQDGVQETVIAVWKNIRDFVYDPAKGSFKTWVLRQTSWRIKGQLRKRMPLEHLPGRSATGTRTSGLEQVPDPAVSAFEAAWDDEWEMNLLQAALHRVNARADAKQYQIFDLTFRKKWPTSQVARTLKISAARVYLAKHRVGSLLKKELLKLKTKPI